MTAGERIYDERLLRALSHPLRARLLGLLGQKAASPSDLARELGEPLGNVSYHVRVLAQLGCLELIGTTPRRGALEHHYRSVAPPILTELLALFRGGGVKGRKPRR